ncbi:tripartite tricarboxylate transporter TctB family protein [Alkalicoccobacillus plakortidis]|uniref:Tripartite tricarboxylate transporter TctB family protein n=1 Tax=Alkalicoccobacillus plakortidis TaxID=444060 RepID=A0ABT0XJ06_9BACI|nr:tripartite tricarboxylate transporter TctB family protein [Alkalicoccobacillus plakortidis]MCM2675887.1 tripartite tricarboxylate transporter TctB family protein [Alkalicoccobacillus plakortidis]
MLTADRIIGIILVAFGTIVLVISLGFPSNPAQLTGPGFFPIIMACLLIGLALFLIIAPSRNEPEGGKGSPWSIIGLSLLYVILVDFLGFFVSTAIIVFTILIMSKKSGIKAAAVGSLAIAAVIIFMFEWLLNVPLPHGWLY